MMRLQTSWYPERYADRAIWRQDIDAMLDIGIQVVRLGEFAWMDMEPRPGEFCWDWLDEAMDMLHSHGLSAMLCTPTACPPIWLTKDHPDVLPVNAQGQRMVHGKRQHRCYESRAYQDASDRIALELAKRYGRHPALMAWQLDNELGGERQHCYCDLCAQAFRQTLRERYHSVDTLNARWGTQFWAETYQSFEQIDPPMEINMQLLNPHNPAHMLAYWRFQSDAIAAFAHRQAEILRQHSAAPVTTNTDTFALGDTVDVFTLFDTLDVAGIDVYTDNRTEFAFYCDLMRSVKPGISYWILEYGANSAGMAEDAHTAEERGAEMLGLFKLRAFAAGQEQGQNGLLSLTGRPLPGYRLAKDYVHAPKRNGPASPKAFSIGMAYDFACAWTHAVSSRRAERERHGYSHRMLRDIYPAAYACCGGAEFVRPGIPLPAVSVLMAPELSIHTQPWADLLSAHLQRGGVLLADTDLFRRDEDATFLSEAPAFYRQLLGVDDFVEPKSPNQVAWTGTVGPGRVVLLSPKAPLDVWTALASQYTQA